MYTSHCQLCIQETETVLGDKTSKINKAKTDVSDFKTKLREKVEACHNHSKRLQKYESDMKWIELEANKNEANIIINQYGSTYYSESCKTRL